MSLYKRGYVWWYKFRFAGQVVRESSKSESKTVAKDAERARRRELEESWNQIKRRKPPPLFSLAAADWLKTRTSIAPSTERSYKLAISQLTNDFGKQLLCDLSGADLAAYQTRRKRDGVPRVMIDPSVQPGRNVMAKGQMRGNKEKKKPKADWNKKTKGGPAQSPFAAGAAQAKPGQKPFGKKG